MPRYDHYRRTFAAGTVLAGLLLSATMSVGVTAASAGRRVHNPRHSPMMQRLGDTMLRLLNRDRARAGVAPLILDRRLARVAGLHSYDMVVRHYFGHDTPEGVDPFQRLSRVGIRYADAAENLGMAAGCNVTTALTIMNADMMAEPLTPGSHHSIIVDPTLSRVGIGLYVSRSHAVYLTEDFTN